jgi:DNA (cytosine-5)-methyltransferase 1
MRRVVADVAPWCVYAENVAERAIDHAADDLEAMGYQTVAIPLAASDLGADHIRDRYWLLAYANSHRELLRSKYAEASMRPCVPTGVWGGDPGISRMADGVADRMDRIRATGNGQVPSVAALAFLSLAGSIGESSMTINTKDSP